MNRENSSEVCTFVKRRPRQIVRRTKNHSDSSSSSSDDQSCAVVRRDRRPEYNKLYQKTSNFGFKRNHQADSSDEEDRSELSVSYKASRSTESRIDKEQCATASLEIDTDHFHDSQALFERARQANTNDNSATSSSQCVYQGSNNYRQFVERKDTALANASSGFNRKGPMRAPTNLRATVRWDYQPDVCKDYKETGFCTFGDSCKFLHDRSDYKHGWQIDQELAEGTYGIDGQDNRYEIGSDAEGDGEQFDNIPWECMLCNKDYVDPVITKCGHYFCSACALKRFSKSARCYACQADTKGSFKFAKDLHERVAASRAKFKSSAPGRDSPSPPNEDNDHPENETCCSSSASTKPCDESTDQEPPPILPRQPYPAEPGWAKPEIVQYCNSSEEDSD